MVSLGNDGMEALHVVEFVEHSKTSFTLKALQKIKIEKKHERLNVIL